MRNLLFLVVVFFFVTACGQQSSSTSTPVKEADKPVALSELTETDRLNDWLERQYEQELMQSPIQLTFLGRKERYGEIDDMSEEAQVKQMQISLNAAKELEANFEYDLLSDDGKLSYDIWMYSAKRLNAGKPFLRHGYVFDQMTGVHSFLPTFLISFHKVESVEDMTALISRISGVGRALDQLIERAKTQIAEGIRPPRFSYEIVKEQAQEIISGRPFTDSQEDSSLMQAVNKNLMALVEAQKIDTARQEELMNAASSALVNDLQPAYERLVDLLDTDIVNTTELAQGVHALPSGAQYYNYRLAEMTTTSMTADEIHELGLQEVARLREEMEGIKKKVGFEGTLKEFFVHIRDSKDNEQFYFDNTDEGRQGYIDEATAAIENIKSELPNYFGLLPKAGLEVKRVEPFREQDGAPQHYYPGTPDGSRPGIYYAHLSDMKSMPKNELEVIAYHEGLPGHHMQISIAQELEGVPTFRRQGNFTAYAEGWGLYSEKLAKEMPGTFTDPYSDFGRLGSEIWRAIRLVVDTGLHAKQWSQQQAVDYFADNSPAPLGAIEAEIRRYLVIPGQATAYKIGMIDIQRMRSDAKKELGDDFDIRGFHDAVLGGGAMPLSILDRRVKQWLASVQAGSVN